MAQVLDSYRYSIDSNQVGQDIPKWKKVVHALDIFSFLPVPTQTPVSTGTSIAGSSILFVLFLGYIIYSFVGFVTDNVPRVNQFSSMIDTQNYTVPDMAIAFFSGEPFDTTTNDPNQFTITMQQLTKFKDVTKSDVNVKVPLVNCRPDWIPDMGLDMLCPSTSVNMSGLLYATELYVYPRFTINYCNYANLTNTCIPIDDLLRTIAGGRLLLYVKNDSPKTNFATGKPIKSTDYTTYQFFLDYGLYLRSEIIVQKQTYTQSPDFFTSYSDTVNQFLQVQNQVFYLSNVTIYNPSSGFQLWVRLAQDQLIVDIVFLTIVDMIAKWGAFWGVLFAAFAIVFLRFNRNKFYDRHKDWEEFVPQKDVDQRQN